MQAITAIGLDIAKSVFQVHGIDAEDKVIIRRQLKRRYVLAFFQKLAPCLVGIEACASSHYWSRELKALGHTVRLMGWCSPSNVGRAPRTDRARRARQRSCHTRQTPGIRAPGGARWAPLIAKKT